MPTRDCPNCGAEVPLRARACPECGSCEQTGWSEATTADGLGLPDDDFNYDDYVKREFGGPDPRPRGMKWFWWLVAVAVLVVFVGWLVWPRLISR